MSIIFHPATGFAVGDPEADPLLAAALPTIDDLARASSGMILSASGWRKVFASDGDEDSLSEAVSPADLVLAGTAAIVFAGYLRRRSGRPDPTVLVGIDSRPTGPALADAMNRVFLASGLRVRYLFIVPAPEIMAYARQSALAEDEERAEGFCYVSASHNPPGHNGFKVGTGGGVLPGAEIKPLIEEYRALLREPGLPARVLGLMKAADRKRLARAYSECSAWKRRSVSAYTLLAREVVTGKSEPSEQEALLEAMAEAAAERPVGVVAELNGSARCLSIDLDFLSGLGLETRAVNDKPRCFAHRIVPEGESLAQCRAELEAARLEDPAFAAGYVPDCDGDRGNLVRFDEAAGAARILEAQEVFALCCVSELAMLVRNGDLRHDGSGNALDKAAIVVNDATSMRINALARHFDADVFRAETGEANVVGLAASLRARGYLVRILGEGSNGGNITHPSQVRDPLATLGALLKLLLLRDGAGGEGLFRIWMRLSNRLSEYRPGFGLDEVVASLPSFATTSAFEPRAALRIPPIDQAELKRRYARLFAERWEARRAELGRRFGLASWEAFATNGEAERRVGGDFAASGSGGLRIVFSDGGGIPRAFLWMRGSGTEPVFRIVADIEGGSAADEEYLLDWHSSMVREAAGA